MIQSTSLIGRSIFNISIENITKTRRRIVEVVPRRENCVFFFFKRNVHFFSIVVISTNHKSTPPPFFFKFFFPPFSVSFGGTEQRLLNDFIQLKMRRRLLWRPITSVNDGRPTVIRVAIWRPGGLSLSLSLFVKKKIQKKRILSVGALLSTRGCLNWANWKTVAAAFRVGLPTFFLFHRLLFCVL